MKAKILAIIILLAVAVTALPILPQKKAVAAVPTIETNAPFIAAAIQTAANTTVKNVQDLNKWLQTFITSTLRRQILDVIVDQIIAYIQGGDKPKFVTDWKGFLEDAGQAAVGDFVQELGLGFLCQPFNLEVQLFLLPVKRFAQRAQCTLDQIVGNINAFRQDFRAGGWIGYSASWEPQNNFFGTLIMALQEREIRRGAEQAAAYNEAQSGGGFLGAKDSRGNIVTPGATLGAVTAKAIGSDIDFILNAEQIGDYASAIASALINRVLTEGIAAVQTSISGSQNTQTQYNNIVQNNFNFNKSATLNSIDMTLVPRQQAAVIIDALIQKLTSYKSDLQRIHDALTTIGRAICTPQGPGQSVNVDQTKAEITADIAEADSTLAQLQGDKVENDTIIAALLDAINRINRLSNDNAGLTELTNINNEIYALLNAPEASNFKSAIEALDETVTQEISAALATYNQRLLICQTAN